jgi:hypothetical protein
VASRERQERPDGPAPSQEGKSQAVEREDPEVYGIKRLRDLLRRRTRGEEEEGEALFQRFTEGEPERLKVPREQEVPTQTNPLGSKKGARLDTWEEAVEAPGQGRGGFVRKCKSGEIDSRGWIDHVFGAKL